MGAEACARACQRVPSFIYGVRPMSLSAGLLGDGCGWGLDPKAGLPLGPPSPLLVTPEHSVRLILGTPPPLVCACCLSPFLSFTFPDPFLKNAFNITKLLKLLVFV